MSRSRVIAHTQAVYVGPSPADAVHFVGGEPDVNHIKQLTRVQSISHSWDLPWMDIRQFGNRAPIDRIILETPIVTIDLSYLLTDGGNEKKLGFNINGTTSALADILDKSEDEKNYFQLTVPQGSDASGNADTANHRVYAFGNGFVSNYSVSGSVGELPTATISIEALNVNYDATSAGNFTPNIDPETGLDEDTNTYTLPEAIDGEAGEISALRPGDIVFSLASLDGLAPGAIWDGAGKAHIQSFNLEVPLSRTPKERLGSKFAFTRELDPLIPVTLTITANMSEMGTGGLSDIVRQCTATGADVTIDIKECDPANAGATAIKYIIKNARVNEQDIEGDLDSDESVSITLSGFVGAVEDLTNNLFIEGSYVEPV